jgi:hypothetical protein
MRGHRERTGSLFSYVSIEKRIPVSHPLRQIRKLADQALDRLNLTFCELYAAEGRPSVPPEQLLLEQLNDNLLFRLRTIPLFYSARSSSGLLGALSRAHSVQNSAQFSRYQSS